VGSFGYNPSPSLFNMDINIDDNVQYEREKREYRTREIAAYTKRVSTFYPEGQLQLITFIKQYDDFLSLTREKCDEL
jgi:hypothetical protein